MEEAQLKTRDRERTRRLPFGVLRLGELLNSKKRQRRKVGGAVEALVVVLEAEEQGKRGCWARPGLQSSREG